MCQWSIKIRHLARNLLLFVNLILVQMTHSVQSLHYHNHYHTHILSQRNQQFTEVFALYRHSTIIQVIYLHQPFDQHSCRFTITLFDIRERCARLVNQSVQQDSLYRMMPQRNLAMRNHGRTHRLSQRI